MVRMFVYTELFDDAWKELKLTDDDLIKLEKYLDVYAKSAKENITEEEKKIFKKLIKTISYNYRKGL